MDTANAQLPTELEEKLAARFEQNRHVIVGIDPSEELLKANGGDNVDVLQKVTTEIVDATKGEAAGYKLNKAFFERHGHNGLEVLETAAWYIRHQGQGHPIILDSKANDIDSSALGYAEFAFDVLHADGVTWNPYLGLEAYAGLLARYERKFFAMLCKTSNKGASELQDLQVSPPAEWTRLLPQSLMRLYEAVGARISHYWPDNCGLVVGATKPAALENLRAIIRPRTIILLPGVGKQGGDLEKAVQFGRNEAGLFLLNIGRAIIAPKPEEYHPGESYTNFMTRKATEYNAQIATALEVAA